MNKRIKYLVVVMLVGLIALSGCRIVIKSGEEDLDTGIFSNSYKKIEETKTVSIEGADDISIDMVSAKIDVKKTDDNILTAEITGEVLEELEPEFIVENDNGEIVIKLKFNRSNNIRTRDLHLVVYVPNDYKNALNVDCISRDLYIESLNINALDIDSTSCDVHADNLTLNKLNINTVSGDCDFQEVSATKSSFTTTSGDYDIKKLITDKLTYKMVSGNISILDFQGDIEGTSTSTDIEISYSEFSNDINIKSTSGNIDIELPDDAEFLVDLEANAGDINCDFPVTVKGSVKRNTLKGVVVSDKNTIKIHGTSTDISIKK